MKQILIRSFACILVALAGAVLPGPLAVVSSAFAQSTTKGEALDPAQIKARAQRVKDMKALLSDPDQNVRLAALDEMIKSNDPVMQEVAFEAGFASADGAMRAVALRAKLGKIKGFTIEFADPVGNGEGKPPNEVGRAFGKSKGLSVLKTDPSTGEIALSDYVKGQISGSELSLVWPSHWSARFRLESGAVLKGAVSGAGSTLPATIRLH